MPRAFDRRQLPVDRDPLKQLDTNYGKLPKLQLPGEGFIRDAFLASLKEITGIDLDGETPFLTWLASRPLWVNLVGRINASRLLAQTRIRAGSNLVSDPGVDNPEFWTQVAIEQVDDTEVTPYAGNYALKLTSLGANAVHAFFNTDSDGDIDPIKVRRGDVFIVEARAFSPTANATGTVQLIGRVRNSRTGASEDIVITFIQMSGAYRGQWQQLYGTVEIPAGYDEFSAGLRLPAGETTATQAFYGDQFVIREATDSQRLFAISSLLARRGSNLLLDPSVEDPVFWTQTSALQVGTDVVLPSSGDTALQITSQGGNPTDVFFNTAFNGKVEPITVRLGEYFAVEARVLCPATNGNGTVQMVARLQNSRSGQTSDVVINSLAFNADNKGSWETLTGYIRVPIGYNQLSVGLRLPAGQTTSGQPYFADELVLRETTSVARLFEIAKLRSRRGSNLVTDPSIEDPGFWTQVSTAQVGTDVVTPSSGDTALRITSRGATETNVFFNTAFDGSIDPITARLGEYYAVEARVFSPSTNTTGNVSLIARMENSRTGAAADVVITTKAFDSPARGSWQKISGYVKVPTGYNRISAGLRLPAGQTTATQPFYADELVIREATAAQRLSEISRLRIRRGSNLVTDPTFSDPEFWTQDSTAIVDYTVVIPYSGNQSLQVTSRGATATQVFFNTADDGSVEPIKARLGETYEIGAYVYAPGANTNGVISLVARLANSRTGATTDVTVMSKSMTATYENSWLLINGFVRIPAGYNQLSAGLALPAGQTTTGDVYFVNEALIRESTAAKRLFDMSRLRTRHGANLLADANFDDAEFWTQESTAQVDSAVITPRTGNYSLQITSRGATPTTVMFNTTYDGTVEPIRARLAERYFVECYAYSPAANSAATMKLIARLANSRTGATEDVLLDTQSFDTLTEGVWQRLSGYVKITAGYNLISAGVMLDANQSTAGNVLFVDDALLRETTAAQRMIDVLFDGFNGSTGAFGKDPDDVYGAMDGVKDGVKALRLARQRAKVGPNFVNDPRIEDSSYWTQAGSARSELYYRNGGSSLEVTRSAAATYAWFNTIDGGTVQPIATWQDDALFVQCWYFAPSQTGGGTVQLVVKAINSRTGAETETVLKTVTVEEAGSWKKLAGTFVMPEGADGFSAGVKVDATGSTNYKVYFDALLIRESTAAQRLFNVSKLRTRAGNNLVTDPNFDDTEFWSAQTSVVQAGSAALTPRTGNYSLQVTSQGATPTTAFFNTALDGTVEPIKTRLNERFYVECYVYSPAANSNGTVKLIARLANSKTGATTDVTISSLAFTSLNEGQWQKLSGYVRITAGYNLISAGLLLDANQTVIGNTMFVDDALIREVTGSQRLVDVLFDGFNGTTGTFGKDPDDVVGSMGYLGDGTKALNLARNRAKVGSNFVNDPRVEDFGYWTQTNIARSSLYRRGGAYSLAVTATSGGTYAWWNTIDGGTIQPISTWLDDSLYMQCFYYAPSQTGTATMQMVVKAINSYTGVTVETSLKTITVDEGGLWKKFSAVYTMPDGADSFSAGVKVTSATANYTVYLDSLLIREATAAQKLIDGIAQAMDGGSATGADLDEPKKALRRGWASLFDGLNGSSNSTDKTPSEVKAAAAAVVYDLDLTAGEASLANGKAQDTVDAIDQAVNGGTGQNNAPVTARTNLRKAFAAIFDGLNGTDGATDKLPSEVKTAASAVRNTATTAQIQVLNKMLGGSNLATNPDFEDTTQALPLGAWSTYSTDVARSGTRSVKIIADAVNNCRVPLFTDKTDYLKFKCNPGEVYQYETFVYGKATNTQAVSRTYNLNLTQGYTAAVAQTYTVTLTQAAGLQFSGTVTGGTYTLSYNGLTTAAINYNDAYTVVQTRLQAIIPSATVNASFTVFLPGNATLTANSTNLVGGTMTVLYNTYRYSWGASTTPAIAFNASNSVVASTIQAIVPNGTVSVTGGGTAALSIVITAFGGPLQTTVTSSIGTAAVSPTTAGTFTLTYNGSTTTPLQRDGTSSIAAIQTALRLLPGASAATVTAVSGGFTVTINNVHSALTASGVTLTANTYTLSYAGQTTPAISYASTALATVKARIEALTTVGSGQTTVTAITSGGFTVGYTIVVNGKAGTLTSTATTPGSATVTQTASSTDGYITFGTLGFNAAGTAVAIPDAGSLAANTALNGKWTKFSTYWTVPDGCFSFCPVINVTNQVAATETYYIDQPSIREVTVATQALNQSNLVLSGDFEDSTVTRHTDNLTLAGAYSTEQEYAGTQSYKLTMQSGDCGLWLVPHAKPVSTTVPGTGIAVQENQNYYFEAWYYLPSANRGAPESVKLVATMTDGAGTSAVVTIAEQSAPTENAWQQLSGSYTVPAAYKFMYPQFRIGANATAGDAIYVDKVIIRDETNQATWKALAETFLGGISTSGTLNDATGALNTIYNTVIGAADTAADLKTERTAAASSGRNYVVNFSKYPERLMAGAPSGAFPTYPAISTADFTLTYSGSASGGSLSILDGQAHWNPGTGTRSVFGKYRDSTLTDYQLLSGTLTTPMRAGGGQNWIVGRCNAANDTFVYAYGYANSLIDYQAELGCYVNGVKTVFATAAAPPNFNLSLRVGVGDGSGVRRYQVLSGSKVIIDYQDTGLVSRLCSDNHLLPANHTTTCTKFRGWAFQSVANGSAVPGDAIQVACADSDPTAVVGSGAKISRNLTSNVSATTGRNVFPSSPAFFNVIDEVSPDLTIEKNGSNEPTGKVTVSLSGWYLIEVGFRVNPTVWSTWNIAPAVFKNGTTAAYVFKVGHDGTSTAQGIRYAHSSFIAYLAEGDWVRPGYDADKNISNVFTGSSTAESYMSITLLNRSYG